jgi:glycosyltransferase involved in cell wall biosynthesis
LLQAQHLPYLILILGLDIPQSIVQAKLPGIQVLGFVEDLDLYLTACQIFLNPVIAGGGIKTKLVEALAYGLNAVSSANGAIGLDPELCGNKLIVCKDADWPAFAEGIFRLKDNESPTPAAYYEHFYWVNITERAARFIEGSK